MNEIKLADDTEEQILIDILIHPQYWGLGFQLFTPDGATVEKERSGSGTDYVHVKLHPLDSCKFGGDNDVVEKWFYSPDWDLKIEDYTDKGKKISEMSEREFLFKFGFDVDKADIYLQQREYGHNCFLSGIPASYGFDGGKECVVETEEGWGIVLDKKRYLETLQYDCMYSIKNDDKENPCVYSIDNLFLCRRLYDIQFDLEEIKWMRSKIAAYKNKKSKKK